MPILSRVFPSHDLHAGAIEAMFTGDVLPECGTYLVALLRCQSLLFVRHTVKTREYVRIGRFGGGPVIAQACQHHVLGISQRSTRGTRGRFGSGAVYVRSHAFPEFWRYCGGCWFGVGSMSLGLKGALEVVLAGVCSGCWRWCLQAGGGCRRGGSGVGDRIVDTGQRKRGPKQLSGRLLPRWGASFLPEGLPDFTRVLLETVT